SGVRHRQRARLVADLRARRVLVLHVAERRVAGAAARAVRIFRVLAAELDHEIFDHAVKVQAVIEACLHELDEVAGGDRHLVEIDFGGERSERGIERGGRVGHGRVIPLQAYAVESIASAIIATSFWASSFSMFALMNSCSGSCAFSSRTSGSPRAAASRSSYDSVRMRPPAR